MSDDEVRALEARWKASGSFADWTAWARAMNRSGEDLPVRLLRTAVRVAGLDARMGRLYRLAEAQSETGVRDLATATRISRRRTELQNLEHYIRSEHRARLARRLTRLAGACLDRAWFPPVEYARGSRLRYGYQEEAARFVANRGSAGPVSFTLPSPLPPRGTTYTIEATAPPPGEIPISSVMVDGVTWSPGLASRVAPAPIDLALVPAVPPMERRLSAEALRSATDGLERLPPVGTATEIELNQARLAVLARRNRDDGRPAIRRRRGT